MKSLFLSTLLILSQHSFAMDYGADDRRSTNIEDRRPAGFAAQRCERAHKILREACINKMDGVTVSEAAVFTGHQEGVARGLANVSSARTDLQDRFDNCRSAYAQTKEICDQAYQEAAAVPNTQGEQEMIRRTANEIMNVYNTGRRKYEKSWSALGNTEVQLQKIGATTQQQGR